MDNGINPRWEYAYSTTHATDQRKIDETIYTRAKEMQQAEQSNREHLAQLQSKENKDNITDFYA